MKVLDAYNREILDGMIEKLDEYGFFDYSDATTWDFECAGKADFTFHTGINIEYGCTKIVFIDCDNDCEWVLKTNIKSDIQNEYYDYCRKEADNFKMACETHVDDYFAACYFYKEVYGREFYVQELVDIDEESFSSSCYDYVSSRYSKDYEDIEDEDERNDRINEIFYDMADEDRIYAIFCDIPTEKITAIVDFIDGMGINDLHTGNFGYRGDQPVILDYSGF